MAKGDEIFEPRSASRRYIVVTKTYRILKAADGLEMDLTLSSPSGDQTLTYELMGPHGVPIEGEWYTGTFREAFVGQVRGTSTPLTTQVATDVVKNQDAKTPQRFQTLPLKFAGIENQYFAVFFEPDPLPVSNDDKWDEETEARYVHVDPTEKQKADLSVVMTAKPVEVEAELRSVTHRYMPRSSPARKRPRPCKPYGADGPGVLSQGVVVLHPGRVVPRAVSHLADARPHLRLHQVRGAALRRDPRKLRHRDHPADDLRADVPLPPGAEDGNLRPEDAAGCPTPQGNPGEV